ncbi:MAG: class I SAM-dependent methyltransferase [Spirochaetes bacterium]|nr:MAG: class I SAM-dependent methyltransferase [Spirochaetota bacterium]
MREKMIKSSLLLSMFNRFDFLIRVMYSRVPFLRDAIRAILFNKLYARSGNYCYAMHCRIVAALKRARIPIKNSVVLEIGPGTSLIMGIGFLLKSARKIILVDKYPRWDRTNISEDIEYLKEKVKKDAMRFFESDFRPRADRFFYAPNSVEDMKDVPDGSVDIIVSAGVLEHVTDMDTAFREMNRILKPRGVMYHYISLADHYNFDKPFKFLKYSDRVWNTLLTKEGYSFTNRLRSDDYMDFAGRYGFKLLDVERGTGLNLDSCKLHKKFAEKNREDLETINLYALFRKT